MKRLLSLLSLLILVACAPQLTINKDGSVTAKGYHSVIHRANGATSYIAKPWWSFGFTDSVAKIIDGLSKAIASTTTTVVQTQVPTTTTTPTPVPVPVPTPTPTPIPPVVSTVLFDLGPCETCTWREMQKAGFPCREGVCLYALGQVARGWPIPGQSEELITIDKYYGQIQSWYESRVNGARISLANNKALTITIIANDAVDRFGFRLGPPTYDLFKDFGGRVTLGTIVPESAY